jgi:hypothetical protein
LDGGKEARYWAWEFPIAILMAVGTLVLSIGIPVTISRSTGWATLFVGLGEAVAAVGLFFLARLNVVRAVAAALLVGGAIGFVFGLNLVY